MTSFTEGGLTLSPVFVSENYAATPTNMVAPSAQHCLTTGEDGIQYYVEQGVESSQPLELYNASTGVLAISKSNVEMDTDRAAAGLTPVGGDVAAAGTGCVFPVPETPYVIAIYGGASGLSSDKRVLYYKINANSELELVGGYAGRTGGLDVQESPTQSIVALGFVTSAPPVTSPNSEIPYKYPLAVAYRGEGRSTVVVLPAINDIIANTPYTEVLTNNWSVKEMDIEATSLGTDIFEVDAAPPNRSKGFFLPGYGAATTHFYQMFYNADLDEHVAATASPSNSFLTTNAPTYPNGLISYIPISTTVDGSIFGFSGTFGTVKVAAHEALKNEDFTSAFPFPDDDEEYDGTAGSSTENYYCNPSTYPSDPEDPSQPWFLFFPRIYRAAGDKDKIGIRVFSYDPVTGIFTYLDFAKAQAYTIGTDVNASTDPVSFTVTWNRGTGAIDLFVKAEMAGASSIIIVSGGTFFGVPEAASATAETLKVRASTFTLDGHKLYVLRCGQQGTFIYDTVTQQWSEFITAGQSNWNFEFCLNWNGLVIGADQSSGAIYKLDVSATQDEGSKDVTRTVTGKYPVRGRDEISCAAVRLTASVGAPIAAAPTVNLRYSDDNGNTYVDAGEITLVVGDYDQELAWRSLGSMKQPGRVFEFVDVGGVVRIDGCTIETDKDDQ